MKVIKIFAKVLLVLVLISLALFGLIWLQHVNPEQNPPSFAAYEFPDTLAHRDYNLDSLIGLIGDNKRLPPGFELAGAIAYSAYPQLKEVSVDMIMTEYGPPMMADIDVWSLFGPKGHRKYQIKLNNTQNSFFEPILLRSLPFDAQVGILAHELGHVAYYHQLNALQIAKWGLCYIRDDEFHATHERTTDLMPVYHGLGSQIYQYAHYVRRHPSCQQFYQMEKDFMDKYYLTDTEIKNFWTKLIP